MGKKIISFIFIITFIVTVVLMVKNDLHKKLFLGGDVQVLSDSTAHLQEQNTAAGQTSAYDKSEKLVASYFYKMNEDIVFLSDFNKMHQGELILNVTDAYLTRDLSDFNHLLEAGEGYYLNRDIAVYADNNKVFFDRYYYGVVIVNVKNDNQEAVELLLPGNFSYMSAKRGEVYKDQLDKKEFLYAVLLEGKNQTSVKGELLIEPGEQYSFALLSVFDEEKAENIQNTYYLGTALAYKQSIPNDDNRIKLVELNFRR